MEVVSLADKYRSEGVVGIDLAGDEHNYSNDAHVPAFKRALELGIHRTVHAGETGNAESVRQAIEHCHAERIGHGYAIIDDPTVYNLIRQNDIHLECCLTSSIQTNAVAKYIPKDSETEEKHLFFHGHETKTKLHSHIKSKKEIWHPIHHFARDGLNFSLSCDDPSVSQITIEHEYEHALADLKLSPAQLTQCVFNAARSTFLNDNEKQLLIQRLIENYIPKKIIGNHFHNVNISNTTLLEKI
jgi:adenosine deaminase